MSFVMILHLHLKNDEKELFVGKLNIPAANLSLMTNDQDFLETCSLRILPTSS